MSPTDLRDLFRHMEWADGEVWRVVLATPGARTDETLRRLLLHLHVVQRAFLDIWQERPVAVPEESECPDAERIRAWIAPYYAAAHAFLDTVDEVALRRPVALPWLEEVERRLGRAPDQPTLAETIFQATSHSTYHRGQVNARLRTLGGEPPLVDYIAWIWFGRPAPASA